MSKLDDEREDRQGFAILTIWFVVVMCVMFWLILTRMEAEWWLWLFAYGAISPFIFTGIAMVAGLMGILEDE